MSGATKREYWADQINGWRASGLSQKAYCAGQGLSLSSFQYWRRRLPGVGSGKLIPVSVGAGPRVGLTIGAVRLDIPLEALDRVLPLVLRCAREVV